MSAARIRSAREMGLVACRDCGLVCRNVATLAPLACPRCGARLRPRIRDSLARTWALLIAAMILYIPANVLPIMRTGTLFETQDNTIVSGIFELWRNGSQDLAVIVFVASVLVPMLKFAALVMLLVSVHQRSAWASRHRARLYRVIEHIGYWSMLDVFVVTLLVALVHFRPLTSVEPRPGVIFFGLVVVLTMLASMSFDPRLIWDRDPDSGDHSGGMPDE